MAADNRFLLPSEEAVLAFGRLLAFRLSSRKTFPAVLFLGPMGSGKTTMIRGMAAALPGGDQAEVSSPSFNIMNVYPTRPETVHFDLYRLEGNLLDPESQEMLLDDSRLVLVEWSEYLPEDLVFSDVVYIQMDIEDNGRMVTLCAAGEFAARLDEMCRFLHENLLL
ncbi:MAG: tRNA (adenosine(37)-N6)-threonylcarbamoyltransferase complex ATPase subunit type 1 TsaE [Desulfonatronovibrionaceae bacterium]